MKYMNGQIFCIYGYTSIDKLWLNKNAFPHFLSKNNGDPKGQLEWEHICSDMIEHAPEHLGCCPDKPIGLPFGNLKLITSAYWFTDDSPTTNAGFSMSG